MIKASEQIKTVEVGEEFRASPACGYERAFHVSFVRKPGEQALGFILISLGCGARYDIAKSI